jgi:crotonobetainyl-CoA:carnitine CoA-transferase CaiB-like acyl-CoA transferase
VAQALSGFLSVVVDEDRPRFLGPALADAITGIYAAFGVLGALLERAGSGRGKLVEVSMLEAMAHFAVEPFAAFFALGVAPKSADRPRLAQAYILRTSDNRLIAIHLSSLEKFWLGLVKALEADELTSDARFNERLARISNYESLGAELDRRFRGRTLHEWSARLSANDVPFAPINGIDAVVEDPQVGHLGLIVPVNGAQQGGRQAVRPPLQFDGEHAHAVSAAPLLDQHGAAIRNSVSEARQWPANSDSAAPRRAMG